MALKWRNKFSDYSNVTPICLNVKLNFQGYFNDPEFHKNCTKLVFPLEKVTQVPWIIQEQKMLHE